MLPRVSCSYLFLNRRSEVRLLSGPPANQALCAIGLAQKASGVNIGVNKPAGWVFSPTRPVSLKTRQTPVWRPIGRCGSSFNYVGLSPRPKIRGPWAPYFWNKILVSPAAGLYTLGL